MKTAALKSSIPTNRPPASTTLFHSLMTLKRQGGCFLLCLLLAMPAYALLFDDEALQKRLSELEERIERIEATIQQLAGKLNTASVKDQELIDQIRQFQGHIEEIGHKIDQHQSVIQDVDSALRTEMQDITGRLQKVEGAYESASALSEDEYYEQGYANYQSGEYQGALTDFSLLIKHHPESIQAANAQYWIGLSNLSLEKHNDAITTLMAFIEKHPRSDRAPAAMLSLADAYAAKGEKGATKKTLESLIKAYPSSLAADSARQRIKSL